MYKVIRKLNKGMEIECISTENKNAALDCYYDEIIEWKNIDEVDPSGKGGPYGIKYIELIKDDVVIDTQNYPTYNINYQLG